MVSADSTNTVATLVSVAAALASATSAAVGVWRFGSDIREARRLERNRRTEQMARVCVSLVDGSPILLNGSEGPIFAVLAQVTLYPPLEDSPWLVHVDRLESDRTAAFESAQAGLSESDLGIGWAWTVNCVDVLGSSWTISNEGVVYTQDGSAQADPDTSA